MADIIQLRRGAASLWTSVNPILAEGEPGLETDTGQRKTGNGVDAWNDLPYDAGGSGSVASVAISGTDGIEVDSGSPITSSGTIALGIDAVALSIHLGLGTAATTAATDYATAAEGAAATAAKTKTDFLTVTQPVDLDAIETRVNALDAAVVLKGTWDASVGTFPGGGSAQAGDSYIVSVSGTVGGVAFVANDRIIAILDSASTTTYAANWHKADYTDAVLSVAGLTGAIADSALRTAINVEDGADVTDAANVTAAGALMDSEVASLYGIKTLSVPDSTTISAFGASLVDDADATSARGTLGLGDSATKNVGTGTGDVAQGNHGHAQLHDAATIGATLSDILSITGQEIGATDLGADKLWFWDDSAGAMKPLTIGSGLTVTDTTITASGGGSSNFTIAATSGDFTDSSGAVADVPLMTFPIAASEEVTALIFGWWSTATNNYGFRYDFTGPASPVSVTYGEGAFTAGAAVRTTGVATDFGTEQFQTSGTAIGAVPIAFQIHIVNGSNAGDVQFRAGGESSGISFTLLKGLTILVMRTP